MVCDAKTYAKLHIFDANPVALISNLIAQFEKWVIAIRSVNKFNYNWAPILFLYFEGITNI